MTNARAKLQSKINEMTVGQIVVAVQGIDGPWETRSPEQHTLRVELLNAIEKRLGGEVVDSLMDTLEATK